MDKKIIPDLKPQAVTCDLYYDYTPEKFELIDGVVFGDEEELKKLLLLLMYNIGLEETVKLAPKTLWKEAINTLPE